MRLKLLQLNIEKGRFLPTIMRFVKKENFDILNFQEVDGGPTSHIPDCFSAIKQGLGYDGELLVTRRSRANRSFYAGQAIFFKKNFAPSRLGVIWLKKYRVTPEIYSKPQDHPRAALTLEFPFGRKKLQIINTHLAWGPNPQDRKYKLEQGKKLYQYLKTLKDSFVLAGDFNVTPDSQIVKWMNRLARNLTIEHNLTNTLNAQTHLARHLFPPGLPVDFIFVSRNLKVRKFQLIDKPNLSDHLGLMLEMEI